MIVIAFIIGMIFGGIFGGLYMRSHTTRIWSDIHKRDMRLAQRCIDDQYKYGCEKGYAQGHKDGYKEGISSIYKYTKDYEEEVK